jgi:hypothetical protein
MYNFSFHYGNRHYPVAWKFGVQNDEIHAAYLYAVVLLEHITVKVLLQTIVAI